MKKWRQIILDTLSQTAREEGQALAEYGLILAFIAIAGIVSLTALGLALAGQLDALTQGFP